MTQPRRIRLSRAKGWRLPPGAVKVDRTTPWGNPFCVGIHGTAEDCVRLHAEMLDGLFAVSGKAPPIAEQRAAYEHARANLESLRGKTLACWCGERAPCHADNYIARLTCTGETAPEPA